MMKVRLVKTRNKSIVRAVFGMECLDNTLMGLEHVNKILQKHRNQLAIQLAVAGFSKETEFDHTRVYPVGDTLHLEIELQVKNIPMGDFVRAVSRAKMTLVK